MRKHEQKSNGPADGDADLDGGSVEIHDVPEGWTVDCDMRVNGFTGEWSAFYILKNGTETYRWYFDGADDIVHTVDELRGFTLTLNGEAVDCDPTKDVEVHEVNPSDLVGYEGQPSTWTVLQGEFTENGVTGYQYVIHPDNANRPARATTGAPPSHSPRRTEGASPTCSTSPTTTSGRM